jgi:hypothetical protein
MKTRNVVSMAIASSFFVMSVEAQLLHEPFPTSYGDGTALGANGSAAVWGIGNAPGVGSITNSGAAALSYSGLQTSDGSLGACISSASPSGNQSRAAYLTPTSSGALYASFLLNVQSAPSANRLIAALSQTNSSTLPSNASEGVWLNSASSLMISKYSSGTPEAGATDPLNEGTHLVVLRYTFNPGVGDDALELWLDPGVLGVAEDLVPGSNLADATGNDVAFLRSFWLMKGSSGPASSPCDLYVDEIRVGTTWAEVTPLVPEPSVIGLFGLTALGLVCRQRLQH